MRNWQGRHITLKDSHVYRGRTNIGDLSFDCQAQTWVAIVEDCSPVEGDDPEAVMKEADKQFGESLK